MEQSSPGRARRGPLKVALVIDGFTGQGGACLGLIEHAGQLIAAGHEVHVITQGRPDGPEAPGCRMHRIDLPTTVKGPQALRGFVRWMAELHGRHRFDVVHSYAPYVPCNLYEDRNGAYAVNLPRQIAMCRNPARRWWRTLKSRFKRTRRFRVGLERAFYRQRRLPRLVALSGLSADWLVDLYGLERDRIEVLANPVTPFATPPAEQAAMRRAWRAKVGLDDQTFCLAFVAHVFRDKGLGFALEALARFAGRHPTGPAVRLAVAGRDDVEPFLRQARRLGLADRVIALGPVRPVEPVYRLADALLYPTAADTFGRVIAESLLADRPVITTRWAGAACLVHQGRNGLLVDQPWDTQALADAVERLADPARRAEMAGHCRDGLACLPTVRQRSARLMELYDQVVSDQMEDRFRAMDWLEGV